MNEIPILDNDSWDKKISSKRCELFSMFSSTTSSITKDMSRMVVPIDDHLVHRGDGVFESFKCTTDTFFHPNKISIPISRNFKYSKSNIG